MKLWTTRQVTSVNIVSWCLVLENTFHLVSFLISLVIPCFSETRGMNDLSLEKQNTTLALNFDLVLSLIKKIYLCIPELGLRAKPSDKSIFSPHLCNCWCTQWAEIHIRRPTGTFSWIMRIQNEEDVIESFPDFPLADICSLFMGEKPDEDYVDNSVKNIDSNVLQEVETRKLWSESIEGKQFIKTGGMR